jgi:hypothetical protein
MLCVRGVQARRARACGEQAALESRGRLCGAATDDGVSHHGGQSSESDGR